MLCVDHTHRKTTQSCESPQGFPPPLLSSSVLLFTDATDAPMAAFVPPLSTHASKISSSKTLSAARAPGRMQLAGGRRGGAGGFWQAKEALEGMRCRDGSGETDAREEERTRPARPPSVAGEDGEGYTEILEGKLNLSRCFQARDKKAKYEHEADNRRLRSENH